MHEFFYITTPIFYVNEKPHIGHAYTTIVADVYARFYRQLFGKEKVFFLTGTDEHGAKVAQSAAKREMKPQEFVDVVSGQYRDAWKGLQISYDEFFRTTDQKHAQMVQNFLQSIYDKGLIYKAVYKGKYCIGCEKFLNADEMVGNKCLLHPNLEISEQEEENYFLKLKQLSEEVFRALNNKSYAIFPDERNNEISSRINQGVEDISISRAGVTWGIPVPWDRKHTVYVWVDALINYYSAVQIYEKPNFWPPTLHLMAKDILWFHSVIWPALLIANELSLPKNIFAHGFFTIDGQKMSKSLGNVIDPLDLVAEYGSDATRYLLLSSFQFGSDGDISLARFKDKYNSDLANGLGNLVARVAKLAEKLPTNPVNVDKILQLKDEKIQQFFASHKPDEALRYIWSKIASLDQQIALDKPWEVKSMSELTPLLKSYIEGLLVIGKSLVPFLPQTAEQIVDLFSSKNILKPAPFFLRK